MDESQYLTVIKVWSALVWADGVVTQPEAAAMRRLIEVADLGADDRQRALGYLEEHVDLDTTGLGAFTATEREGIYRAAVKLSAIDDDIADSEIDFLDRLRKGLQLDDETAEKIEDSVANGG